ncbi:MAG: type III-A CRISPR-associated protein Csm2 [Methylicorpusculum sp.]|uniref:type III-A CRISPR-associated protein Csm2 n=1 Tax=Methylicorpusculum sp. TaxID=2713644 RepID=UPI002728A3F1|nr:type III-A CRISPR-associated protein Csm2 [Methylicorpusculum sp.]MDO8940714.1 type III-A CRISPR-associated protein Csm2 [Methylicorpusculum sp.]MDP2203773.1 type III-A CRISPR-associated protein Csm2 [Methylicorpusculum sp.]
MANTYQQRQGQGYRGGRDDRPDPIDTSLIQLKTIKADLLDNVAQNAATTIADNRNSNKPTQLRRFYDEIVLWDSKVNQQPEKFEEYLPFIRMINAKVAYALGRKLVDPNFVKLINDGLRQVDSVDTMRHFKLFMEAFMGFYKEKRPKD